MTSHANPFDSVSFAPVGFDSQSSTQTSKANSAIQTEAETAVSNAVQTVATKDAMTQTLSKGTNEMEVDYDKLALFLRKVAPKVIEELDEAYGTSAFDDYQPECLMTSADIKLVWKAESQEKVKLSCLCWNSVGSRLAVSQSVSYHATFCDHLTKLLVYQNTNDADFESTEIEVDSCITSLSFHKSKPNLLAVGTHNGEVLLWNLPDLVPTLIFTCGDSVSDLRWQAKPDSVLFASSRDGSIIVFKSGVTTSVKDRFKIAEKSCEGGSIAGLLVTSFDLSPSDSDLFVVGTLAGRLYKCSCSQTLPLPEKDTFDPIIDEFEGHDGSITCIRFLSNGQSFLSSGTDREIRIFSISQFDWIKVVDVGCTVVGFAWKNANVFAGYGAGPKVRFFEASGKALEEAALKSDRKADISCLGFSNIRSLMAVGDISGTLEIWKIPSDWPR